MVVDPRDDAAAATAIAVERGEPGVYNIVDDEPAAVSAFLPFLAAAVGAKSPMHVPVWLARLLAGDVVVGWMTTARGASNDRAKRVLGWQPVWGSWRDGFRHGLGTSTSTSTVPARTVPDAVQPADSMNPRAAC